MRPLKLLMESEFGTCAFRNRKNTLIEIPITICRLYAGPEVDVWSCGVILYVMLCGRLPFDDDYIPALFKKINGGIFTLPSFLSPAVKSLLQSMLTVDPLKRITIAQIRQLDWFKKGLPDYLQPLPEQEQIPEGDVDESIVSEIMKKMGFSRETVVVALKEKENNQIKVAYELVLDHRRMLAGVRHSHHRTIHHYLLSESPPAWNAPIRKQSPAPHANQQSANPSTPSEPPAASSIQILSSSLPKPDPGFLPPPAPGIGQRARHKTRSKWHFGIRSRSAPNDIMLEIYKALKNIGMKWRTVDPYYIRCLFACTGGQTVKLDIQLYQVETNNYLVDFKNATAGRKGGGDGGSEETCLSVFAFFEACSKLITELAISA